MSATHARFQKRRNQSRALLAGAILVAMIAPASAAAQVASADQATAAQQAANDDDLKDDTEDKDDAKDLDAVVVTATGNQQWIKDAPASISVITREDIERKPVSSIGQLLSIVPGVTGGYALTGAQSKIKLRGLPQQYTLILIDGRRQGNSSGLNYRDDMGPQDLNWISPDMIERIEVIRGPMSSLYGSDAMGGVINIITRKIATKWGGTATYNFSQPDASDRGATSQIGTQFSGPVTDQIGIRLGANLTNRKSDRGVDQTPGTKSDNINALLNWNLSDDHRVGFDVRRGVQRNTGEGEVWAWGLSRLVHTGYGLNHDGRYGDASSSKTSLVYNRYEDKKSTIGNKSEETVFDAEFNTGFDWVFKHALNLGGQWKREQLINSDTIGTVPITWTGSSRISPESEATSKALFAEDHISLRENLVLTLGLRWDNTDNYDDNLSPRIYAVWHPNSDWTVRGGVSRGFRAPNLKQGTAGAATQSRGGGCYGLIPEGWDFTSANADGTFGCYMAGNPNLEPETSTNYEIGAGFDRQGWSFAATYFFTDFKDKIEQIPLRDIEGQTSSFVNGYWWTVAQNIDQARTRGVEGSFTIPLHARLRWQTNLTRMLESKNKTTGADLLVVPKITINSSLDWEINDDWALTLSAQHIGEQATATPPDSRSGPTFAQAYTTYDLSARYDVNAHLTLRAGVLNLSDTGTLQEGNNYDGGARIFFLGLNTRF